MIYPKITEWVKEYTGSLSVTLDPDNSVLIDSKYVELFYKTMYRGFVSIADSVETLKDLWDFYLLEMLPQLQREYKAITMIYNPLENYSMVEHGEDSDLVTNNLTIAGTTSTSYGQHESDSTEKVAPYDTENMKNASSVHVSDGTHTDTGSSSTTNTGDVTTTKEHDFTRSGNVGITTSQQMLQSELEVRKVSIVRDFLRNFATRYFFIPIDVSVPVVPDIDDLIAEILRRIPKAEEDTF